MDCQTSLTGQEPFLETLPGLLAQAGLASSFALQPLPGGGNNRVYRVLAGSGSALLKVYFRHPGDPRDRLGVEFAFTRFAWNQGIRRLPRPLACDSNRGLGLYEFVEGRRLQPGEVNTDAVQEALAFYRELNQQRRLPEALQLPVGSEACFCLADHLHCVDRRLSRFDTWSPRSAQDRWAARFLDQELRPWWRKTSSQVEKAGLALHEILPQEERRLSPSDFGFHNAIREPSGTLRFLDFEYAGWDDPAKLACDFFCQPEVPVPTDYWDLFLTELVADLPQPDKQRRRMARLLPVYQVKWLTIMLNDFLTVGDQRRNFARPGEDPDKRKEEQLLKAQNTLRALAERAPSSLE